MEASSAANIVSSGDAQKAPPAKAIDHQPSDLSSNESDLSDDDQLDTTASQMLEGLNVNSKIKNLLKYTNIDTSSSEDDEDDEEVATSVKATAAQPTSIPLFLPKKPRVPTSSIINRMERRTDWSKPSRSEANKISEQVPTAAQDVTYLSVSSLPKTPQREASPPKRTKANKEQFKKILSDMLAEESSSDESDNERLYTRQNRVREELTPQKKPRTPIKSPRPTEKLKKGTTPSKGADDAPKAAKIISTKAKIELHKESERLYRSADMRLSVNSQPKKTMASFLEKMQLAKKSASEQKPKIAKASAIPDFDSALQQAAKQSSVQSDSDSDLEIIGSADQPTTLSSAVASYSPVRVQVSPKKSRRTPVKKGASNPVPAMTHKDLNATLKQAISAEMLKRRKEMEVRLKEKGLYTSAEELARKHLDREKEAQSIHEEVERMHAKTLQPNAKKYADQSEGDGSDADDSYGSEREDWEDNSGSEEDQFADSDADEIEVDQTVVSASPIPARRNRKMAIISDDDSDEDVASTHVQEAPSSPIESIQHDENRKSNIPRQPIRPRALLKKNDFVENEAEEEEDEYMGLGGVDGEDEGPDEYVEDDVVVHANDEELDEAQLRQAYNNQIADSDQNEIQRLIKDVVSGGLRRRRGAMNDGYELDYYDTFDDMDDNLVALRRAAAAKRRKLLNGNILQAIADNPQTAAFAKASKVDIDEDEKPSFSDGEEEESQPILLDENSQDQDDESDDDQQVSTFSETIAAMKQSSINEEVETVMEEITVFTEEPISNDVEEDMWSSVTVSHRKVTNKQFTSPLQINRVRASPLFRSPGKLQKFKTLLQEAGGSIGGSSETGSHVGFSAPSRAKEDRSASVSSQRSNSSSTSASQESYTTLSRKNSRLLDILSSQESSIA